jgi:XTP/dITP diphosphohydrolase
MRRLVIASNNAGKLKEISAILAPLAIEVVPQSAYGVQEAAEPHVSFVENAIAKARHACLHTQLPALADDSGVCVAALGGAPGVYSARYAGEPRSDARNNAKLIADLQGEAERGAHYYCVIVLLRHADDPQPVIAEGAWHGEIVDTPRGDNGFGYDPYFLLPDFGKTAAELDSAQKNRVSHRARALNSLVAKLREQGSWL